MVLFCRGMRSLSKGKAPALCVILTSVDYGKKGSWYDDGKRDPKISYGTAGYEVP